MDRQKTLCLQCSEELQGRSDKKFCNYGFHPIKQNDIERALIIQTQKYMDKTTNLW